MTFTHALATNNYGPAKFIVDASAANGTHTTIAAALTSASSGDTIFIRPGTYTENLTLKAGVNLVAYDADALTPNVIISGKCTLTTAGTVSMSGIQLKTNSDFCLAVTGSAASIVKLRNCAIIALNNTAISLTSSGGAEIDIFDCSGDILTTGIAFFATTAGTLRFFNSFITNSGLTVTNSTCADGSVFPNYSGLLFPITVSGTTGMIQGSNCIFGNSSAATLTLTLTSTSANPSTLSFCDFNPDTASAISIGAGATARILTCTIRSTNTNAITGSGTLIYGGLIFTNSATVNTTTQTCLQSTTFTPALQFGGSSTGITYSVQQGFYLFRENRVDFTVNITLTSKGAQTGTATLTGFPISTGANGGAFSIPLNFFSNFTLDTGYTTAFLQMNANTTTGTFGESKSAAGVAPLSNTAFANNTTFLLTGFYLVI